MKKDVLRRMLTFLQMLMKSRITKVLLQVEYLILKICPFRVLQFLSHL